MIKVIQENNYQKIDKKKLKILSSFSLAVILDPFQKSAKKGPKMTKIDINVVDVSSKFIEKNNYQFQKY